VGVACDLSGMLGSNLFTEILLNNQIDENRTDSKALGKPQKLFGNHEELKLRFPRGIGNVCSKLNFEILLPIT
jgi:hypothetical protein